MTTQFIDTFQTISIRGQSNTEKLALKQVNDLIISGKKIYAELQENGDLHFLIKSDKK